MKDKYIKAKAMLLAGTFMLTGAGLSGCNSNSANNDVTKEMVCEKTSKIFKIGEHIISVPISNDFDIRNENIQYEYHAGYEPIGISATAYGKFSNNFGGASIVYANTEEVQCDSYIVDENNNNLYTSFGIPVSGIKPKQNDKGEFDIGEHIISVPISNDFDIRNENIQYEYHEGYELVGIATTAYGMLSNNFGGGALLYKNIVPVKCTFQGNGYTTFGVPQEKVKSKN